MTTHNTPDKQGEALIDHEVAAMKRRMLYLQSTGASDCGLTPWSVLRLITTIETDRSRASVAVEGAEWIDAAAKEIAERWGRVSACGLEGVAEDVKASILKFYIAAAPPIPSDAAMRAAEEWLKSEWAKYYGGDFHEGVHALAAIITRHLAATVSDKETSMNTVTFGDSKNIANPDVSCPRCGGTKPTCCSCPEPKQFSLPEFAREFTQAAINAHVGFKHETRWHDCDYASCAKWRDMIDTLNTAAATTSPETPVGGEE